MEYTNQYELIPIHINHNGTTDPNKEYVLLNSSTLLLDGTTAIGLTSVVIETFAMRNNHTTDAITFEILKNGQKTHVGDLDAGDKMSFLAPNLLEEMTAITFRDVTGNYVVLTSTNIEWKIKVTSNTVVLHAAVIELVISYK